ncbi:NrdH-redoxin [Candidatus Saccharibacteria bacterium TM7i]|nr:NrdH-redoxin [Candidatus Saccharibacteria bacterium TM7i]
MSDTNNNDAKVIVYRTSWCAFCHTEMQWLERLGVKYVAKDIEEDEEAHKELMQKINGDFRGVPVTDIAGDIILGFDRPKLQDSLKNHGLAAA